MRGVKGLQTCGPAREVVPVAQRPVSVVVVVEGELDLRLASSNIVQVLVDAVCQRYRIRHPDPDRCGADVVPQRAMQVSRVVSVAWRAPIHCVVGSLTERCQAGG